MRVMNHDRYEILLAFCQAMSWAADVETVYGRLVDTSYEYLECDAAHLHIVDIDGKTFVRLASRDNGLAATFDPARVTEGLGRMTQLIRSRELIVMDYDHPDKNDVIPAETYEAGYHSGVSIPLYAQDSVLGMLTVVYKRTLSIDEDDREFLLQLGAVLGTFVQRMQMTKKDLELQMLRERKQLASEIHDNVSQLVSALAIRADIAQSCREDGDDEGLDAELTALANQARKASKILREEMLSLRAPFEGAGDVISDVEDMVRRFKEQWGVKVDLEMRQSGEVIVSEYVRLQLARIVNECFQNILRHSAATAVDVVIDRKNGNLLISISDNGHGFDVASVAPERLGIRIMRERAASAGGKLTVASSSHGTTVFVEVPAARRVQR